MEGIGMRNNIANEKTYKEEEILNSNNIELITKYAKENRSQKAINQARYLLELSRRSGEKIVQSFLESFKECEDREMEYLDFEKTESGKKALVLLNSIPEPFKTNAENKLKEYKKQLENNTELIKKNKNDREKIWKEVFGFDYYNVPIFKERFKNFLFNNIKALSEEYYKDGSLEVKQDPFAINFFVEDAEKFSQAYTVNTANPYEHAGGFSVKKDDLSINVVYGENKETVSRGEIHEKEHSVHRVSNPFNAVVFDDNTLNSRSDFLGNIYHLNSDTKWAYQERLKKAVDEIFAYFKNNEDQNEVELF